jgi:hypothetical protein
MDDDLYEEISKIKDVGGRPTKLNDAFTDKFCQFLTMGCYIETVCRVMGIHVSTFYDWLKRGQAENDRLSQNNRAKPRKKEAPFKRFSEEVVRSMGAAEVLHVGTIYTAGVKNKDPKVSAGWLKMRYAKRYTETSALELSGPGGGPIVSVDIETALRNLTPEEQLALDNIVSKMRGVKSLEEMVAATYIENEGQP